MNICGCLVHVMPDRADAVRSQIEATDGVEVHAAGGDGRIVIVVEDIPGRNASETIMQLHQLPGVISITLTYHHFEDQAAHRAPASPMHKAGGQSHDHL